MRVSLNTFVQFIVIFVFIIIFGWNLLSFKEGLIDESNLVTDGSDEIVDKITGKKRKMTDKEKEENDEALRKRDKKAEDKQKRNDEDMNERIGSFKR